MLWVAGVECRRAPSERSLELPGALTCCWGFPAVDPSHPCQKCATRTWPGIAAGASPRGGISLVRAARGQAVISGRDFVTPDDVKAVALPALRHRVTLAPEVEIEGQGADAVLEALLQRVEAPRS